MTMTAKNALLFLLPSTESSRMLIHSVSDTTTVPVSTTFEPLEYAKMACFSPDGTRLNVLTATGESYVEYRLHVYDVARWKKLLTSEFAYPMTEPSSMVSTGDEVVVAHQLGVRVLDSSDGQVKTVLDYEGPPVEMRPGARMALTPEGDRVLIATQAFGLMVINTEDWTVGDPRAIDPAFGMPDEDHPIGARESRLAQFSPDGSRFFFTEGDTLRCFNWPEWTEVSLPAPSDVVVLTRLLFQDSSGTKFLCVPQYVDESFSITAVDVTAGTEQPIYALPPQASQVFQVDAALSPDGSRLAIYWKGKVTDDSSFHETTYHATEVNLSTLQTGVLMHHIPEVPAWTVTSAARTELCLWTPGATLSVITGKITDDSGAPVARAVAVCPRDPGEDMPVSWASSDPATGRYTVPVAASDMTVSRIVFDSTGNFNDLIDKVVL